MRIIIKFELFEAHFILENFPTEIRVSILLRPNTKNISRGRIIFFAFCLLSLKLYEKTFLSDFNGNLFATKDFPKISQILTSQPHK